MRKKLRLIRNELIISKILLGENDAQIARSVNLSTESVRQIRLLNNLKANVLGPKERIKTYDISIIEKIIELNSTGISRKEIGLLLNLNKSEVERILYKRNIYSKSIRTKNKSIELSQIQKDILIGLILGDGYISNKYSTSYLKIDHSLEQKEYAEDIFSKFSNIFKSLNYYTRKTVDKRNNKLYKSVVLQSLSIKELRVYRDLFYNENTKIIPNDIEELLTPIGLAYLFMDDGKSASYGFYICTDGFTKEENEFLVNCINRKFNLKLKISKTWINKYRIFIPSSEKEKFVNLIRPFIIPSMYYKLTYWKGDKFKALYKSCELLETPEEDNQQPS